MKKLISMLLVLLMLVSLCANACAEETKELIFTPDIVMERLEEGDHLAWTAEEQTVNGVFRLAEMLGTATAIRASDEECENVNACLERIYESEAQDFDNQQKLAVGAMQVFNLLEMIAEQEDPAMKYQSNRDSLREYFSDGDDDAQNAKQQTVNALYSAAQMAALILEEFCPTEEMIAYIEEELEAFSRDNNVCEDADDQIVNGAYWLQRMLTAMVTHLSPSEDYTADVLELSAVNTQNANSQPELEKELVVWLYSCVQMSDLFAKELLSEVDFS